MDDLSHLDPSSDTLNAFVSPDELPDLNNIPDFPLLMQSTEPDQADHSEIQQLIDDCLRIGDQCLETNYNVPVDVDSGPHLGQWRRLEATSQNGDPVVKSQIQRYYNDFNFYLKFRILFQEEIERKCWHEIDASNAQLDEHTMQKVNAIYRCLKEMVQQKLRDSSLEVMDRGNLESLRVHLENEQQQPIRVIQVFQKMLKKEQGIIELAQYRAMSPSPARQNSFPQGGVMESPVARGPAPQSNDPMSGRIQTIMRDISDLTSVSRDINAKLEQMFGDYQRLRICTNGNIQLIDSYDARLITNEADKRMWQTICSLRESIVSRRRHFTIETHRNRICVQLELLLKRIAREIKEWHRAQAYASNGKYVESCDIDQLEDCCKPLAQLLSVSLEQVIRLSQLEVEAVVNEQVYSEVLHELQKKYEDMVKELVEMGLVAEKQPPQVLMKDKKFLCQLRHLVADGLSIHQFRFDTRVTLVNTEVARAIKDNGPTTPIKASGKIVNDVAKSDFVEQTRQLHVHMRNMSLSMRQRGDRGRADVVAEEKFCMVFRANISLRFPSMTDCIAVAQTMSLPIVVISHGKQEADAQATIFWDNAFSEAVRHPFEVPDQVQWSWILDGLHWLWVKECERDPGMLQKERGLSIEARKYLTLKLFGRESVDPTTMVSWRQFNRENLPTKSFTFWSWFFKVMELVSSQYVKKYWNEGLIHGFIGKADCQRMLLSCQPGTFMFRFSDSVLGALSISCYTQSNQGYEVGHLEPDTVKGFNQRSLPDTVKDINYLFFLYPNRPKNTVFGSYYTRDRSAASGTPYWRKTLRIRTEMDNPETSNPTSPQPLTSLTSDSRNGYGSPVNEVHDPCTSPFPMSQHQVDHPME